MAKLLSNLPSMSELLDSPQLKLLLNRVSRSEVVARARRVLDELGSQVQTAAANVIVPAPAELAQRIAEWIGVDGSSAIVPVINATGVVVADSLGRAPLAEEAIEAMARVSRGYANLELDLTTGEHVLRGTTVERQFASMTGAERAVVVNNQAAALLVTLGALAAKREVLVARGQLGESAGGERLAAIIEASGAVLREVGSANRTRVEDFAGALGAQTGVIIHAAAEAYELGGIHEQPTLAELVGVGRRMNVPVIDLATGGAVVDFSRYGLQGQPVVEASLRDGAAVVILSGDKLLGGPECGIVAGRRSLLEEVERHSLFRMVQIDKGRLAALAATLRLLADGDLAERSVPVVSLLSTSVENLRQRAERLAPQIAAAGFADVLVEEGSSFVLGSPLDSQKLPTVQLSLIPRAGSPQQLAGRLRNGATPVIGRVVGDRVVLDLRSVPPREDLALVAACEALRVEKADATETESPNIFVAEE